MVRVLVVVVLFLGSAMPSAIGASSEETPAEFANRFYRTYGTLRVRGIPDENQCHALAPFFSAGLLGLFAKADAMRHRPERLGRIDGKRSGGKSAACDGDLFTSNSPGCAATYAIAFPQPAIGRLLVPIRLADPETADTWVDELVLHHRDGGWAIDDIIFTNDRSNRLFGKGTLRRALGECMRRLGR